jgi:ligand-binding sensor domain-containing protein
VSALAVADTVLAVGTTSGELFLLHTGDGRELPPPLVDVGRAGPVVAVAMDGRALWVAGPNGVTVIARPGGAARYLPAGTELPGDVTSLALQPRWAWVGTRDGIVRYRREADGSIR